MNNKRITDISMSFEEPMRGFRKTVSMKMKVDGWNASTLEIYSHAGTHMDAPLHFEANDTTIDKIPVERFICNCHIIRLKVTEPGYVITKMDVESIGDHIRPGEGVIFETGWSHYKDDPSIYRDQLPRISNDLARWMVKKQINLLGVEPPSIGDVNNLEELQEIHRILLDAGILILEGLCNLDSIQLDYGKLVALPLKISGGDGAPVRAIFLEEQP
ncbi:MAG: cyclase family protein [Bacteroidales bacterium]|nr:cyclase family protein [Bacteroidales bacterium]